MSTYLARWFTAAAAALADAKSTVRLGGCALAFCAASASAQVCNITGINPASPQLPNADIHRPYSVTFTAVGSLGPGCPVFYETFEGCQFGDTGLALTNNGDNTATLSGTPTTLGSFSCTVDVFLDDPSEINKTYTVKVVKPCVPPQISSAAPPPATAGVPYDYTVIAAGKPPLTFTATGLPTGLSIQSGTGEISGTTDTPGSYPVTITVSGCGPDAVQVVTFVVAPPPPPPPAAVTLSLASQPNPSLFGQSVAVLAHASGGSSVPTGSVMLCVIAPGQYCAPPIGSPPSGTAPGLIPPLLTATLDGNGNASYTLTGLLIQNYVLQAYYGGDAAHLAATSAPLDQFVIKGVVLAPGVQADPPADPPPAPIPTLSWTGLAMLVLALAIAGLVAARSRRNTHGS